MCLRCSQCDNYLDWSSKMWEMDCVKVIANCALLDIVRELDL
jgi:hypothetical protein